MLHDINSYVEQTLVLITINFINFCTKLNLQIRLSLIIQLISTYIQHYI